MALPAQVRRKIEEAEKIQAQLSGDTPAEQPPVDEVELEVQPDPVAPEEKQKAERKDTEAEESSDTKVEEKSKKPDEDVEIWKQKYRTLQGMYDKEVPSLHQQIRELKQSVEALSAAKAETEAKAKESRKNLVTEEDEETFGRDLIEVQRKVAREVAAEFEDELAKLRSDNEALREMLEGTSGQVRQGNFRTELLRLVPDFEMVDSDPEWIKWLDTVDPILRAPRRTLASRAYENGDAQAVAHYVNLFRAEQAPVEQEPAKKQAKQQELERQIQPSRKATSVNPESGKGKLYSSADISEMFKRIVKLNNSGRFEEANKLEAEIDSAYAQNRVTG